MLYKKNIRTRLSVELHLHGHYHFGEYHDCDFQEDINLNWLKRVSMMTSCDYCYFGITQGFASGDGRIQFDNDICREGYEDFYHKTFDTNEFKNIPDGAEYDIPRNLTLKRMKNYRGAFSIADIGIKYREDGSSMLINAMQTHPFATEFSQTDLIKEKWTNINTRILFKLPGS